MAILGSLEGTQGLLSNVGNISDVATGIINNPGTMVNQQLNKLVTVVCGKAMSALYQILPIDSILNLTVGLVNVIEQLESGNTTTLGSMAYDFAMAMMTSLGYGQEFALATKVFNLASNYMNGGTEGVFGYEDLTTMLRSTMLDLSTKALLIDINNCAHLGSLPNAIGDLGTRLSELFTNLGKIQNPLDSILAKVTGDSAASGINTSDADSGPGAMISTVQNAASEALGSFGGGEFIDSIIKNSNGSDKTYKMSELINLDKTPGHPVKEGTVEGTMSTIEAAKTMDNGKVAVFSRIMARILPSLAPDIMVQFRERLRRVHPSVLKLIIEDELMKDTSDYCGEWFIKPVKDKSTLRMDSWKNSSRVLRKSLELKLNNKISNMTTNAYKSTNKLFVDCLSKEFKSNTGARNSMMMVTSQDYQLKGDVVFRDEHMGKTIGGILTQIAIVRTLGKRLMNVNYLTPIINRVKPNKNIQPIAFNNGFVEFTKTGNVNPRQFHTIDLGGIK